MQVKHSSGIISRGALARLSFGLVLAVCLLHLLYYFFITSRLDTAYIMGHVANALGSDVSAIKLVAGGRRCDGMIMFEFVGDRDILQKFKPELSDTDPVDAELLREFRVEQSLLLQGFRSFIDRFGLGIKLNEDVDLYVCSTDQLPVPSVIYIVTSLNRSFLFVPY